jgi:glycosyltransferase involved in cell wall biosynthesis
MLYLRIFMISVAIITKNESHIIGKTLAAVQALTDDIIIGDTGSADNTITIAKQFGAHVIEFAWHGFGHAKNKILEVTKYDWVLAIDADEVVTDGLINELKNLPLINRNELYYIPFVNFIGNRKIEYGDWISDKRLRLFNKTFTKWDDKPIHETVLKPEGTVIKTLKYTLKHYCYTDFAEFAYKMTYYGNEMAQRYFKEGKKASFFKLYIYPRFVFFYSYIFKLGFLDGLIGFESAKMFAYYAFIKYHRLKELQNNNK